MSKPVSDKRTSRSFSMNDAEFARCEANAKRHGFENPSAYVRALMEADELLQLRPTFDPENQRVLRTPTNAQSHPDVALVREMQTRAHAELKKRKQNR